MHICHNFQDTLVKANQSALNMLPAACNYESCEEGYDFGSIKESKVLCINLSVWLYRSLGLLPFVTAL